MKLLTLLFSNGVTSYSKLIASALFSAIGATLILAVVNIAAQELNAGRHKGVDLFLAALFAGCCMLYLLSDVYLVGRVARAIEAALHDVRCRFIDKIARADVLQLEQFGGTRLYESVVQDTESISRNAPYLAMSFRSFILVAIVMIYMAVISTTAAIVVIVIVAVAGRVYMRMSQQVHGRYMAMFGAESRVFERVTDLLDGFKEVRLNSRRSADLGRAFADVSEGATDIGVDAQIAVFNQTIFGQTVFFLMLGVIVFVVPAYSHEFSADVVKVTTAAIFMVGPLSAAIQSVTVLAAAEAAANRMLVVEEQVGALAEPRPASAGQVFQTDFESISLDGLSFSYPTVEGERPFSIGPIDLKVRRGEIVFITGGNGAGKTTLFRILSGIIVPDRGTISIDGTVVTAGRRQAYRELISAVFSDFHLFRRLYGHGSFDEGRAQELMSLVEMGGVTDLTAEGFGTTTLSSGQRKRLALVAALLEARPLLLLDEWAADQDPYFRRRFYEVVLPRLKEMGWTIVAVTHDERYFGCADRCLHFAEGTLTHRSSGSGAAA